MTSDTLKTIPVQCLSAITSDKALQKVIRLLPNYGIKNLLDLSMVTYEGLIKISGLGKNKTDAILRLADLIKDEHFVKSAIDYYERYMTVHLLPSDSNEGELPATTIKRFLKEYIQLFRDLKKQKFVRKTFIRHDLVELAYIHNYTREMIAENKKIDVERVRQILSSHTSSHKSFVWQLHRMAKDGYLDSDASLVQLSDNFRKQLSEIEKFCKTNPRLDDLKKRIGLGNSDEDRAILQFILHYMGAKLFGGDTGRETRIKEQFVVYVDAIDLAEIWGKIFLLLDDKIVPYAKEALLVDVKKQGRKLSPDIQETIINIIENSNQFEKNEDGIAVKYQLPWKELCSAQSRVERIVYEMGAPCSRQDIIKEYNRRAKLFGIKAFNEDIGIKSRRDSGINRNKKIQNIVEYNAGGVWAWKDSLDSTQTYILSDIVEKYLINKCEECSFTEIYEYVTQYIKSPNKKSIKTILNKLCYSTRRGYYLYKEAKVHELHNDIRITTREDITLDIVNVMERDKSYSYHDIESLLSWKKVRISKIVHCCERHPEIFLVVKSRSRKTGNRVSINPDWDGVYEPQNNTRQKKEYKDDMRRQAIHLLRVKDGYQMPKTDLIKHIKVYMPDNIKSNNAYKIINNDPIFIVSGTGLNQYVSLNTEIWAKEYQQAVDDKKLQSIEQIDNTSVASVEQPQDSNTDNVGAFYDININFDADMKKLRNGIYSFVKYELQRIENDSHTIEFDVAWDKLINSMNIQRDKYDDEYERIFVMLYRYLFGKTDIYDRYYLYCDLLLSLEAYMKQLVNQNYKGLYTAVEEYQNNGILPNRDLYCTINKYLSEIINSRNKRAHNEVYTLGDSLILSRIKKLLVLYLYIAYRTY